MSDISEDNPHMSGMFTDGDYALMKKVWELLDEYQEKSFERSHSGGPFVHHQMNQKQKEIKEVKGRVDELIIDMHQYKKEMV